MRVCAGCSNACRRGVLECFAKCRADANLSADDHREFSRSAGRVPDAVICAVPATSGHSRGSPRVCVDPTGLPFDRPLDPAAARSDRLQRQRLELAPQRRVDQVGRVRRRADDGESDVQLLRRSAQCDVRVRRAVRATCGARARAEPLLPARLGTRPERSSATLIRIVVPAARQRGRSLAVHSCRRVGHHALAACPDSAQISRWSEIVGEHRARVRGVEAATRGARRSAASMTPWKIGAAPVTPLELRSGVRSKLPTQTPTVTWRESRSSSCRDTPATCRSSPRPGNGNSRLPPRPKTNSRASASERMSVIQNAVRGDDDAPASRAAAQVSARTTIRRLASTRRRARTPRRRPRARRAGPRRCRA